MAWQTLHACGYMELGVLVNDGWFSHDIEVANPTKNRYDMVEIRLTLRHSDGREEVVTRSWSEFSPDSSQRISIPTTVTRVNYYGQFFHNGELRKTIGYCAPRA